MSQRKFTREDFANCLFGVVIGIIIHKRMLADSPDWILQLVLAASILVGIILVRTGKRE